MMTEEFDAPLSGLMRRLQSDPRFMSYVLAAYRRQESLNVEELARDLGVQLELLPRLALCKRPDPGSPQFAEQVREIADYTLTDESQLANILRQVDSLEKLARRKNIPVLPEAELQALPSLSGLLAAARDRDETEEQGEAPADEQSDTEA